MTTRAAEFDEVFSGLPSVGRVPWGTHLCHFYQSPDDLREAVAPYFRAGLERGERCLWVTAEPVSAEMARSWLAEIEPRLQEFERSGQIEILDGQSWYRRSSGMDGDAVLHSWFDRIDQALAQGFRGLRICGDTAWLERKDWDSFVEYESCVHRSFAGRPILALCCYRLDRCTLDDLLDVMRNHEFALIRRNGAWEAVHTSAQLVDSVKTEEPEPSCDHSVHFFSEDRYPAAAIADFLAPGIAGGAAAAIASQPHLAAIRAALQERGIAAEAVQTYDAEELVLAYGEHGEIDGSNWRPAITAIVDRVTAGGSKAYIYGEIVDVLARRHWPARAAALERVWNEVLGNRPVALLCGYELSSFRAEAGSHSYLAICGNHSHIRIDASPDDQQILAGALSNELKARRELKGALQALRAENLRRKAAERRLAIKAQELERSNTALQEFAFAASHDLREPLRKVLLFGRRLAETLSDRIDDRESDYLRRMLGAAERMDVLVRDVLEYSRVSRVQRPYERVDLAAVVHEAVSNLDATVKEASAAIEVEPLPSVEADALQLRRLFQNLIENALKFRRDGEAPRVHVHEEPAAIEGMRRVVVADNGIGFEPRYADKIFQLFQRLHGRSEFPGSGLGLAICRRIAEQHDGRIWAEPKLDRGSRFIVELPELQASAPLPIQ